MKDARQKFLDAVKLYDGILAATENCSDGNCIIRRNDGMHTNGGCRCASNKLKMARLAFAARALRAGCEGLLPEPPHDN